MSRGHLKFNDVSVVVVLWAQEFVNIWIGALCAYTAFVFFSREQLHHKSVEINDTCVFAVQCIAALIIAFLVDIGRLRKMVVTIIGVALFALTPFSALLTTMTNSLWSGLVMFWPCSVLFATLPASYTLMFNQKLEPSSRQIRRILSILEMCNALIEWITFISLPQELDNNSRYSVVFMWVITLPLLITVITLLESIRRFVRGDFTIDNSVKSVIDGIRSDCRQHDRSGRSLQHVVLFLLLLLPQMSLLVISSVLDSSSDEDAQPQDPILVNLLFAFRLFSIPVMEVTLAMTQMNEDKSDYAILLIAHVVNIVILVVLAISVTPVSGPVNVEQYFARIKRGVMEDIVLPEPGQAAFLFINGLPILSSNIFLKASVIRPDEVELKIRVPFSGRAPAPDDGIDAEFHLGAASKHVDRTEKIRWTGNRFHLFSLYYQKTLGTFGFKHFVLNIQLRVTSSVLIVNTIANFESFTQVVISSADGSFEKTVIPPTPTDFVQVEIPAGKTTFTLQSTIDSEQTKFGDIVVTEVLDGYEVYVVYMTITLTIPETTSIVPFLKTVRVFHRKPPTTTTSTEKIPEKSHLSTAQEVTVYAMAGAVMGISSVSYVHFFWMESPVRLRATMFALLRVGGAVVGRFTPLVVSSGDLTATKAYSLLSLQVFTTIAHLALGWIFNRLEHRRK